MKGRSCTPSFHQFYLFALLLACQINNIVIRNGFPSTPTGGSTRQHRPSTHTDVLRIATTSMRKFLKKIKGIRNHFTLDHLKYSHTHTTLSRRHLSLAILRITGTSTAFSPKLSSETLQSTMRSTKTTSSSVCATSQRSSSTVTATTQASSSMAHLPVRTMLIVSHHSYFLEHQMFSLIVSFIDGHNVVQIKTQLIQTVFILIDNLHDHGAVYYLLSNDHINHIITHPGLDLSESIDLLSNYITFLKTLALKMDSALINFFYNQSAPLGSRFPIFSEAASLFNNREQMVRVGVRVVVLSIFKTATGPIRDYVLHYAACPYFANLVWFVRKQVKALSDKVVSAAEGEHVSATVYMDEIEDVFNHFQDIYDLRDKELAGALTHYCLFCFIVPQLLESLTPSVPSDVIHPSVTFAVLNLLFKTVKHAPLLNSTLESLLSPSPRLTLTHPSLVAGMEVNVPPQTIKEALAAVTTNTSSGRKTALDEIKTLDKVSFPTNENGQTDQEDDAYHEQRDEKNPFLGAVLSMLSRTSEHSFHRSLNASGSQTNIARGIVRKSSTLNNGIIEESQQSNGYWTDEENGEYECTEGSSPAGSDADSQQDDENQSEKNDMQNSNETASAEANTKSNLDDVDKQNQGEDQSPITSSNKFKSEEQDSATIKRKNTHGNQNIAHERKEDSYLEHNASSTEATMKDIPVVVSTNTSESILPKDINIIIEDEAMLLRSVSFASLVLLPLPLQGDGSFPHFYYMLTRFMNVIFCYQIYQIADYCYYQDITPFVYFIFLLYI